MCNSTVIRRDEGRRVRIGFSITYHHLHTPVHMRHLALTFSPGEADHTRVPQEQNIRR